MGGTTLKEKISAQQKIQSTELTDSPQNGRESLSATLQTGADAQDLQRIAQVKHQGNKKVHMWANEICCFQKKIHQVSIAIFFKKNV